MRLLKEVNTLQFTKDQINESIEKNNGVLKLRGVIQRADTKNANGRIYPYEILKREIENYKKLVKERRSHGELDHCDQPVVNLKNVSHIISDIEMDEDGVVYGEIEILNTPMGEIVANLVKQQITVGISSRALGSVVSKGDVDYVQDDLHILCWDMVSELSTPGAYMFKESKQYGPETLKRVIPRDVRIDRVANEILSFNEKIKNGR